jgi:hypothetical protein
MNLPLIFLILGATSGFVADKKLETDPDIGIPATAISLICTTTAIMLIILGWSNL